MAHKRAHTTPYGGWSDYAQWAANDFHAKSGTDEILAGIDNRTTCSIVLPDAEHPHSTAEPALSALIRPYVRSQGRFDAALRLEVETVLSTVRKREDDVGSPAETDQAARVLAFCRSPSSVAEIAAHLGTPLGEMRLLLADLVAAGRLSVHEWAPSTDGSPSLELLRRLRASLQNRA